MPEPTKPPPPTLRPGPNAINLPPVSVVPPTPVVVASKPDRRRQVMTQDQTMDLLLALQEEKGTIKASCRTLADVQTLLEPRLKFRPNRGAVVKMIQKLKIDWQPRREKVLQPMRLALTERVYEVAKEVRRLFSEKVGLIDADLAVLDRWIEGLESDVQKIHKHREDRK